MPARRRDQGRERRDGVQGRDRHGPQGRRCTTSRRSRPAATRSCADPPEHDGIAHAQGRPATIRLAPPRTPVSVVLALALVARRVRLRRTRGREDRRAGPAITGDDARRQGVRPRRVPRQAARRELLGLVVHALPRGVPDVQGQAGDARPRDGLQVVGVLYKDQPELARAFLDRLRRLVAVARRPGRRRSRRRTGSSRRRRRTSSTRTASCAGSRSARSGPRTSTRSTRRSRP